MNNKLSEEYETLQDILKKLYQLLKQAIDECAPKASIQVIVDSIKSVKADERALTRRMKAGIYKSFTKKEIEQYNKEEAIKKAKKEKEEAERKAREEQIKKEKRIKEFEDAQIVFDGEYKLVYNNGNKVFEYDEGKYWAPLSICIVTYLNPNFSLKSLVILIRISLLILIL